MAQVNRVTGFFLILGVVILVVSVTGTLFMNGGPPAADPGSPAADINGVWGSGTVDVATGLQYPVAGVPGIVAEIVAKEETPVKGGDVLLRLNDVAARAEITKLRSQLAVARFDVNKAQLQIAEHTGKVAALKRVIEDDRINIDLAEAALKTAEADLKLGGGYQREFAVTQAGLALARAKLKHVGSREQLELLEKNAPTALLDAAHAQVKAFEEQIAVAEKALEQYVVKAPCDGRVVRYGIHVGGQMGLPDLTKDPAIMFCPNDPLVVRADINQADTARVKVGQSVVVTVSTVDGEVTLKGKVDRLASMITRPRKVVPEPDVMVDARNRECVIKLDTPPPDHLVVGTRVRVQIQTAASK